MSGFVAGSDLVVLSFVFRFTWRPVITSLREENKALVQNPGIPRRELRSLLGALQRKS